jgi:hypothetical protein
MADDITSVINSVFSDGPSSQPDEPSKPRIRQEVGPAIQTAIDDVRDDIETVQALVTIGRQNKASVRVATTTAGTFASSYENGDTVDGVVLVTTDSILIQHGADPKLYGIYTVNASGAPTRRTDADTGAELVGATVYVREGTVNKGKTFSCSNSTTPTLGVDAITFVQVGQETSLASVTSSAGAPDAGKISALDAAGKLSQTFLNVVETSTGAPDAGKILKLDGVGKQDISTLPKEFEVGTTGPLWSAGGLVNGQDVSFLSIEDDAAQTMRGKFIDALSDKADSAEAKLTPYNLFIGDAGFSFGDGLRAWFSLDYAGGKGKIWSPDFQTIRDNAAVAAVYPFMYPDGDSRAYLSSLPGRVMVEGWVYWTQLLSGHRLDFQPSYNHGVGGSLVTEMRNRMGWLRTVRPGWLPIIAGINDRREDVSLDESIAEMTMYVNEAMSLGFRLIIIDNMTKGSSLFGSGPPTERTHSEPLASPQAEYQQEFRRFLADLADNRNVFYVDPCRKFIDHTTGLYLTTASYDDLHFTPAMSRVIGAAIADIINTNVPPRARLVNSNVELYSANSPRGALNANPMWVGTSGTLGTGCSGALANSWSAVAGGGLTAVFSKAVDANDLSAVQQVVVTGTPTGTVTADDAGNLDPTPISVVIEAALSSTAAADILFGMSGVEVSGTGLRAVSLCIETTIAGVRTLIAVDGEAQNVGASVPNCYFDSSAWSGISETPRTDALSGTPSAAKLKIMIVGARTGSAGAAINVTAKFRATSAHKFIGA